MKYRKLLVLTFILACSFHMTAKVKLADIFSSNMVLQRNINVKVWGSADPGENLLLSFNGQELKTQANKKGKWLVILKPMQAGGPFDLTIQGKNKLVLSNILIGDVWVCSGQSNMEFRLTQLNNPEKEIEKANYPKIRLFDVPRTISNKPLSEIKNTSWKLCTPENIRDFSAVGYFFGRDLQQEINVPIGLINATWGGTCVESWTSEESIVKLPNYGKFAELIKNFDAEKIEEGYRNSLRQLIGDFPEKEVGMTEQWMEPSTDHSGWKTMEIPGFWEDKGDGYKLFDGIVWFSYNFNIDTDALTDEGVLNLGKLDNSDITWVNGIKVGEMQWGQEIDRFYKVPLNVLKPVKNNITIRIDDRWGKGGFAAKSNNFFLQLGQNKIPLAGEWKFKVDRVYDKFQASPNEAPSLLYNGMIHPLIPYGIKGVIWYQGENNASRAMEYRITFPNMITNWRHDWSEGDFPFLFVQLANFGAPQSVPGNSNWAELRESQTKALKLKHTGMATAVDIGETNDIHPKNKQEVGRRLMLAALKVAYGKNLVYSGPTFKSMEIKNEKAIISFDHIGSGLTIKGPDDVVDEFEIAGNNQKFYNAHAKIEGDKVIVWSDEVKKPVAVRFAWANNPNKLNLYNKEGLPTIPFRTDDWAGVTDGKTFTIAN